MALFNRAIRFSLQVALCMGIGIVPLASQGVISLVGSGSSVPSPLYNAWAVEYGKLKPIAQVRYLQMGAAEGMRQISQGVGDFAAGEIPLMDTQMHKGKSSGSHVLVAIVPIYKLPGEPELRFSGELLADIFLGNVKNWKDARIAKLN
jgi:phosphate transport system substrate-binding protein